MEKLLFMKKVFFAIKTKLLTKNNVIAVRKKKISKGFGDTVEKIIKATGLDTFVDGKDCGCDKRKEFLNNLLPYRTKARCFTEQEYLEWKQFTETKTITLSKEQVKFVCELYASVFNRPIWYPCASCSPKPLITMIDKLDLIYNTYEK